MRFQTTLISSLVAAALSGCGGSSGDTPGDTSNQSGQINASYSVSCVDSNQNWQCDEDVSNDASTLKPAANQYVLLEERDAQNTRTRLLISEAGKNTATGQSTLKTLLGKEWSDSLSKLANSDLEAGFAKAIKDAPLALAALQNQALAIKAQGIANPSITPLKTSIATASELASWQGGNDESRQLTSIGSVVLSNTDSNRVYLFDANGVDKKSNEIDLIPMLDNTLSAAGQWIRGALEKTVATLLMVDTVSAASTVTGPPSTEKPLPLPAGKGLAGVALLKDGKEALLLVKNGKNNSSGNSCEASGNEGVFQVSIDPNINSASYRNLGNSPQCLHSGFSLIAANDQNTLAWDDKSNTLWQLDPKTLQSIRQLPLKISNAQALAISASGRYAALGAFGQISIVDLQAGQVLSHLSGEWSNVSALTFAAGQRRLLIASGSTVFTLALDIAMQTSSRSSNSFNEEVRGLAVSSDGDSFVAASDKAVYWRSVEGNLPLGSSNLASGLSVKRVTLAGGKVLLLSQGAQDLKYRLHSLALNGMQKK